MRLNLIVRSTFGGTIIIMGSRDVVVVELVVVVMLDELEDVVDVEVVALMAVVEVVDVLLEVDETVEVVVTVVVVTLETYAKAPMSLERVIPRISRGFEIIDTPLLRAHVSGGET